MTVRTRTTCPAFTLVEMLVVLLLIAIMAGMLFPVMGAIRDATGTSAAGNTVAIAVETARYIVKEQAAADKPFFVSGAPVNPNFSVPWSGAAALFTASGQIRLIECDQAALSTTLPRTTTNSNYLGDPNNIPVYHGYSDVPGRDYITLPSAKGIVGIIRTNSGLHLITPPFAVRFNKAGILVSGDPLSTDPNYDPSSLIIYNGNYDRNYGNASVWGPKRSGGYTMPTKDELWENAGNGNGRYRTAFEQIESVIGVVLFDPTGIDLQGDGTTGYIKTVPDAGQTLSPQQKIMAHGKVMLFNRYTGVPIRKLSHD